MAILMTAPNLCGFCEKIEVLEEEFVARYIWALAARYIWAAAARYILTLARNLRFDNVTRRH